MIDYFYYGPKDCWEVYVKEGRVFYNLKGRRDLQESNCRQVIENGLIGYRYNSRDMYIAGRDNKQ